MRPEFQCPPPQPSLRRMNSSPAAGMRFRLPTEFPPLRLRSMRPASTVASWPSRTTKISMSLHGSCPRIFSRISIPSTLTAASPTISATKSPTKPRLSRFSIYGAENWTPAMKAVRAIPYSLRSPRPFAPATFRSSHSPICSSPSARTRLFLATKPWTA
jgi:hypothetical protein